MSPTSRAEWLLLVHSVFSLRDKIALLLPSLVAYQGEVLREAEDSCMQGRLGIQACTCLGNDLSAFSTCLSAFSKCSHACDVLLYFSFHLWQIAIWT